MRIIGTQGALGQVRAGAVVFDTQSELREYVKGMVKQAVVALHERLPRVARMFVSAEKLSDLAGWALDRVWPQGSRAPDPEQPFTPYVEITS
jgi:hypothetical protein